MGNAPCGENVAGENAQIVCWIFQHPAHFYAPDGSVWCTQLVNSHIYTVHCILSDAQFMGLYLISWLYHWKDDYQNDSMTHWLRSLIKLPMSVSLLFDVKFAVFICTKKKPDIIYRAHIIWNHEVKNLGCCRFSSSWSTYCW